MGVFYHDTEFASRGKTRPRVRPGFVLALIAVVGVYFMSRKTTSSGLTVAEEIIEGVANTIGGARGLRNNNPGNIERTATVWRGMSADQSGDSRFIVFSSPEWGIRAMARVLRNYINRGQDTVREIINTWAPPSENDTGAYVRAVAASIGVDPDARVSDAQMPGLIAAIIKHENGSQPYPQELIARGIELERTA
jgi:hypothetical protein